MLDATSLMSATQPLYWRIIDLVFSDPKVAGAQEDIFATLAAIIEQGDEMGTYTAFGYKPIIEYLGGNIKYVPEKLENGFQPDIEILSETITDKTKAMILVSPDNPTGRVINQDTAKVIAELAADHDFCLLMDEAYKTLIYEGKHSWVCIMHLKM